MSSFKESPEWVLGRATEEIAFALLRHAYVGTHQLIPCFLQEPRAGSRVGPTIARGACEIITCDILAVPAPRTGDVSGSCETTRGPVRFEVKHKSAPVYYRRTQQWRHGIDHAHVIDYQAQDAILLIHEKESPVDPGDTRNQRLEPRNLWLAIPIRTAVRIGDHVDYPHRRTARNAGMLVWDRAPMRAVTMGDPSEFSWRSIGWIW